MANVKARTAEAEMKPPTLAELAGGGRAIQLYEDLKARFEDGRLSREDYSRAVCQFVQKAMEALIDGTTPAPPKPVDTRPLWARQSPPLNSPDHVKWQLLQSEVCSIEDIEEIQQAGGSEYFGEMLSWRHPKKWALGQVAEKKAQAAAKNSARRERWPNK